MYAVTKPMSGKSTKKKRASVLGRALHFGGHREEQKKWRPHLEDIDSLSRSTGYTPSELRTLYRGFKQECPDGFLTEDTLKQIFSQLFPCGDSRSYAHLVYRMVDSDESGSVTFEQLVACTAEMARGTVMDKLKWIYALYDVNRDGEVTRDELKEVITSIYDLTGKSSVNDSIEYHANAIFKQLDLNGDGAISQEEFIQACKQDPIILKSLSTLDSIF